MFVSFGKKSNYEQWGQIANVVTPHSGEKYFFLLGGTRADGAIITPSEIFISPYARSVYFALGRTLIGWWEVVESGDRLRCWRALLYCTACRKVTVYRAFMWTAVSLGWRASVRVAALAVPTWNQSGSQSTLLFPIHRFLKQGPQLMERKTYLSPSILLK